MCYMRRKAVQRTNARDWAHLDQSFRGWSDRAGSSLDVDEGEERAYLCVQGQVVLRSTSACLRASVGSHRYLEEVLRMKNVSEKDRTRWVKLGNDEPRIKSFLEENGVEYQIPIFAPKGSVVLWLSSTIHSAMAPTTLFPLEEDPRSNGRLVFYVCYRPFDEFSKIQRKSRVRALLENRGTPHWGDQLVSKNTLGRFGGHVQFSDKVNVFIENPERLYDMIPFAEEGSHLRKRMLFLAGVSDIDEEEDMDEKSSRDPPSSLVSTSVSRPTSKRKNPVQRTLPWTRSSTSK